MENVEEKKDAEPKRSVDTSDFQQTTVEQRV